MNKFKAGDLVYCPALGSGIYKIELNENIDVISYPYKVVNETRQMMTLSHHGLSNRHHYASCVFPVSDENYALITKLYDREFEKPRPRQVIEHLLKTHKYVACYTSDINEMPSPVSVKNFITHIRDRSDLPFEDAGGDGWRYAVPFDIKTGEVITEIEE